MLGAPLGGRAAAVAKGGDGAHTRAVALHAGVRGGPARGGGRTDAGDPGKCERVEEGGVAGSWRQRGDGLRRARARSRVGNAMSVHGPQHPLSMTVCPTLQPCAHGLGSHAAKPGVSVERGDRAWQKGRGGAGTVRARQSRQRSAGQPPPPFARKHRPPREPVSPAGSRAAFLIPAMQPPPLRRRAAVRGPTRGIPSATRRSFGVALFDASMPLHTWAAERSPRRGRDCVSANEGGHAAKGKGRGGAAVV